MLVTPRGQRLKGRVVVVVSDSLQIFAYHKLQCNLCDYVARLS